MQIRAKAYVQMISRLRALDRLISATDDPSARDASPLLVFVATVLTLLLAVLQIDCAGLPSLGLMSEGFPVGP